MNFIINEYNDSYYIFKLCRSEDMHRLNMLSGFNHLYCSEQTRLYTYDGFIEMPHDTADLFKDYCEGDLFSINERGIVNELFSAGSNSNALITTPKCNSNCIMCPIPENVRKNGIPGTTTELLEIIRYLPRTAKHITITGGEPTLIGEGFFDVLEAFQFDFDETYF